MKFITFLICFATLALGAQEKEFQELLSNYAGNASEFDSFCKGETLEKSELNTSENLNVSRLNNQDGESLEKMSTFLKTYEVGIYLHMNGYKFHVADYSGGLRVVTALDGPLVGLQAISVNGLKIAESSDMTLEGNSFTHRYPKSTFKTYSNKQIAEFY